MAKPSDQQRQCPRDLQAYTKYTTRTGRPKSAASEIVPPARDRFWLLVRQRVPRGAVCVMWTLKWWNARFTNGENGQVNRYDTLPCTNMNMTTLGKRVSRFRDINLREP